MSTEDETTRLLKILQSHGQSFLDSFSTVDHKEKKRKGTSEKSTSSKKRKPSSEEKEEWCGINSNTLAFEGHSGDENDYDHSASGTSSYTTTFSIDITLNCPPSPRI